MKKKKLWFLYPLLCLLLVFGISSPVLATVDAVQSFYGDLTIEGGDAPVGTVVIAKVDGTEYGRITTETLGVYGGSGGLDPKLVVQGPIDDETTVDFYVTNVALGLDEVKTNEIALFDDGGITEQHLTVGEEPVVDTTAPTVVSTVPLDVDINVPLDVVVSATFSEVIQEGDNFGTIDISGAAGVSASIVGDTLTIAHDAFDQETLYEVTIPAGAVKDLSDNPLAEAEVWSFTTGTEAVGPVSFDSPLNEGWNLLSTPILLAADSDTLGLIFDTDVENIEISYSWDAEIEDWDLLTNDYELLPLYGIYVKISSGASATAVFTPSEELSWPPTRELQPGLNLIGPAPVLDDSPDMPLDEALASILVAGEFWGYTIVISPQHNQPSWTYGLGGDIEDLMPFQGYWVFMENADTLCGFSTTPLQFID